MGSTGAENAGPIPSEEPRERWTAAIPSFLILIFFWFAGIVFVYGLATELVNGKLMADPSHHVNLILGAIGFVAMALLWTWGMIRQLAKNYLALRAKRR